jgi:hypothetical protein
MWPVRSHTPYVRQKGICRKEMQKKQNTKQEIEIGRSKTIRRKMI